MRIISGFQIRQILDETLAVPGGEVSRQFSGIVSLNEIGSFLFGLLQTEQTVDSLVAALLEEYEVEPEPARQDVLEFLEQLRSARLLIE